MDQTSRPWDRMPVILDRGVEEYWLNPDMVEPERLLPLLKQYPADKMEEWRVGDAARNPRNDYPEVITDRCIQNLSFYG